MENRERRASLWDKIFKKPEKPINHNWLDILSGRTPLYSSGFGNNIYASDVVQQAIYAIVSELKKLDPVHVRKNTDGEFVTVDDNIQSVLEAPNPLMTTADFIEKIAWNYYLNYNVFIYPQWAGDKLIALYPLQPQTVEFDPDFGGTGECWVRFRFPNGYVGDLPYDSIIHIRKNYSVSEYMGGNENGQPDFAPLLDTVQLNDTLLKGLAKSLNIQTTINGIIKIKRMVDYDEQLNRVKEFENQLQQNKSGLLATDIANEFVPIQKQIQLLDATTLEFIDRKILRNFGVSIPIINGDFTPEQYQAFYQKTLEHVIKTFGQAFTKGIFSTRASLGFKNAILFYAEDLIFHSTSQRLEAAKLLQDGGSAEKNEIRHILGLRPKNKFVGQIAESSNKTNAENNKVNGGLASGQNSNDDGNSSGGNLDDDISGTDVAQVETDKVLNGAQTQSLIQTILAYKEGTLTYDQTVNIISISIGITKEEAEELLGDPSDMSE